MKTVLLTGLTGLLGKQLVPILLQAGYRVMALCRSTPSHIPERKYPHLHIIILDKDNYEEMPPLPFQYEYVIHAAAKVSYQRKDKNEIFRVNTDWTVHLAKHALQQKVSQFLFISSISALGKGKSGKPVTEETEAIAGEFVTNYGMSKRLAEQHLRKLQSVGLPLTILSPSVIIGPAPLSQSSARLIGYVADEKPFYTEGLLNYVDVRTVVEACLAALTVPEASGQKFILNAGAISYKIFFTKVAQSLQKRAPFIPVPRNFVIFGALLELLWSKIMSKAPTLSLETAKMAGKSHWYDGSKAERILGLSYRSLEDAVDWTIQQMQKQKLL